MQEAGERLAARLERGGDLSWSAIVDDIGMSKSTITSSFGPKVKWTPAGLRARAEALVYRGSPSVDHPYVIVSISQLPRCLAETVGRS